MTIVGGGLILPHLIPVSGYRAIVEAELSQISGKTATVEGAITASLLPPSVRVDGINIANSQYGKSPSIVYVKSVIFSPSLGALLSGKVESEEVTIYDPLVNFEILSNGLPNWLDVDEHTVASDMDGQLFDMLRKLPFRNLHIHGGRIKFTDLKNPDEVQEISGIEGDVDLKDAGAFSVDGSMDVMGEKIDVTAYMEPIIAGKSARTFVNFSGPMTLAYEGQTSQQADGKLVSNGEVDVGIADINRLLNFGMSQSPSLGNEATTKDAVADGMFLKVTAPVQVTSSYLLAKKIMFSGASMEGVGQALVKYDSEALKSQMGLRLKSMDADRLKEVFSAYFSQPIEAAVARSGSDHEKIGKPSFSLLPTDWTVAVDAGVSDALLHGQHVRNVVFKGEVSNQQITVNESLAEIPGDGKMTLFGVASRNTKGTEFTGSIEAGGKSLRDTLLWLGAPLNGVPKDKLNAYRMKSNLLIDADGIRFREGVMAFDQSRASGAALIEWPRREGITYEGSATIRIDQLQLDEYIPKPEAASKSFDEALAENVKSSEQAGESVFKPLDLVWLKGFESQWTLATKVDKLRFEDALYDNVLLRAVITPEKMDVEHFEAFYKGSELGGAINIDASVPVPVFKGTLSAKFLNIDALLGNRVFNDAKPGESWSRQQLDFSYLSMIEGNVSIKCDRAFFREAEFTDVSSTLKIGGETLQIGSLKGNGLGGSFDIKGNITGGNIPSLAFAYSLGNFDLDSLMKFYNDDLKAQSWFEGRGSMTGTIDTSGVSIHSLVNNMESASNILLTNINVRDFDLNSFASRVTNIRKSADVINLASKMFSPGQKTLIQRVEGPVYVKRGELQSPGVMLTSARADGKTTGIVKLVDMEMNILNEFSIKLGKDRMLAPIGIRHFGSVTNPERELETRAVEEFVAKRSAEKLLRTY